MNNECLLCGKPLEYIPQPVEMECSICHKKEVSKTMCQDGHYICNECHTKGMDRIWNICLSSASKNPVAIIDALTEEDFCHMHGPEHHTMVGAALLTAYKNAGGDIDLPWALEEIKHRGQQVPGGACGFWGACGADLSSGMYISIVTGSTPLASTTFGLSHEMTGKALLSIGKVGGPRCCKRDSYLAIKEAVAFTKEHLKVEMEESSIVCRWSKENNQCIGMACPFFTAKR